MMQFYSTDLKKIKTSAIKECVEDLQLRNKVSDNGQDLTKETPGEGNRKTSLQ